MFIILLILSNLQFDSHQYLNLCIQPVNDLETKEVKEFMDIEPVEKIVQSEELQESSLFYDNNFFDCHYEIKLDKDELNE